jgi:hypothetical protein
LQLAGQAVIARLLDSETCARYCCEPPLSPGMKIRRLPQILVMRSIRVFPDAKEVDLCTYS